MASTKVVVLGGSGFVGRHLVNRLVSAGYRVAVPTRRRESAKHLITLPTVQVVETDVYDERALARLLVGSSAAINLVGIISERRRGDFRRAHTELPMRLIGACRRADVKRLIQLSALHADPNGPSEYQRTKGEAESLIAGSGLDWTIFQPSVIFGREDSFLNLFARLLRLAPLVPLASPEARFQPVWVGDVAEAICRALPDHDTVGKRYPLCGPKVYTLRELVEYVGKVTGRERAVIGLGPGLSQLQARVLEVLPGRMMTRDNLASMTVDSVCDGPFPETFGMQPAALEAIAPTYLAPDAVRDRFFDVRSSSGR
jgi:NADH dehydrogenase